MNSQISQISEIMEDIKEKISDNEYKIIMDNAREPTTGRRMTEEQTNHFKNVRLRVKEIKQQQRQQRINQ